MNEKAQLIRSLNAIFKRWEKMLNGIPAELIARPGLVDQLSLKDIVAHLTAWQQVSVARLEASRSGQTPEYPAWHPALDPDSDEELDKINAWIQSAYRDHPWPIIHAEWKTRFNRFLELAKSIPEKDLLETGKFAWLPEYPLSAVLFGSLDHHQEHLDALMAFQKAGKL